MDKLDLVNQIESEGVQIENWACDSPHDDAAHESLWAFGDDFYLIVSGYGNNSVTKVDVEELKAEEGDDPGYILQLIQEYQSKA